MEMDHKMSINSSLLHRVIDSAASLGNSTYSKAFSYTALSCTDLADARFLIVSKLG